MITTGDRRASAAADSVDLPRTAAADWQYCRRSVRAYGPVTIAIRAPFKYDSSTIQLQHATTSYKVFRALAYEIDSSAPRESVVGVSCMLIDSSMHTIFTLYLYRPSRMLYRARIVLESYSNRARIATVIGPLVDGVLVRRLRGSYVQSYVP